MAEGPNVGGDSSSKEKEHTSSEKKGFFYSKTMTRYLPHAVGVTAVGVSLAAVPVVVAAAGFGAGGIAAGSLGAAMMSAAATKGVGLAVVSTLQSVGAAGMAVGTKVGIGATVYPVTSKLAKNYWNRNNKDSNNKANSEGQTPDGVRTETSNDGNASTARVGMALSSAFHSVSAAGLAMGTKVTNGAANTGKSALNYFKAEGKRQSTDVESNVRYTAEGERQDKSNSKSTNNGTIVNAKL